MLKFITSKISSYHLNLSILRNFLHSFSCKSLLDIGCGYTSMCKHIIGIHKTGLEPYLPDLITAKKNQTHDTFINKKIQDIVFKDFEASFDAVIAIDVLEHLPKSEALFILPKIETLARKIVILYIPNGFLPQKSIIPGDFQEHLSGWTPQEMNQLGYKVLGGCGPKWLRGEFQSIKYKPLLFWGGVSYILQVLWYKKHPKNAAALWCFKTINNQSADS